MTKPTLTPSDFKAAATRLRVDEAAIRAVTEVESLGGGFWPDDQIKILYERHVMYRQLGKLWPAAQLLKAHTANPDLVNDQAGGYAKGATAFERGQREHDRLRAARLIHNHAALESCSWGMFQIMGFHWQLLGFASVVEFVLTLSKSEGEQLSAFCRFIESNTQLINALRSHDWVQFARLYNGKGYAKNQYDTKLRDAYKKWSKLK